VKEVAGKVEAKFARALRLFTKSFAQLR